MMSCYNTTVGDACYASVQVHAERRELHAARCDSPNLTNHAEVMGVIA